MGLHFFQLPIKKYKSRIFSSLKKMLFFLPEGLIFFTNNNNVTTEMFLYLGGLYASIYKLLCLAKCTRSLRGVTISICTPTPAPPSEGVLEGRKGGGGNSFLSLCFVVASLYITPQENCWRDARINKSIFVPSSSCCHCSSKAFLK